MTGSHVFGNTRAGRTRLAVVAAALFSLIALVLGPAAFAVHDAGPFQLDGDASTATQTTPSTGVDDWDRVCHQVTITNDTGGTIADQCASASDTTGATAVSWTAEPNLNSSIFTGGGSKDPIDINQWAWKDGAGGLPDKDNLLHSFAARYSVDPDPNHCPVLPGQTKCELLYFGSDRYDNSGDAQQGFWFFQNKIGLGSTPLGGGTNFTGLHKNGDLLVISDFSNGGGTSTITVYKWNSACTKAGQLLPNNGGTCGDANLQTLQTSNDAKCSSAADKDGFCGIVNPSTVTMPWSFTDKSGTANNGALNGEFYEGGVNLSLLNLGGECFSSIASETRSSTSTTAVLKDFVLGQFAVCGANLSTTPSAGAGGEVSPGTSVTDTATVQGTGTSSPPTPTGDVTFSICGPTATNSTALCTTGGTQVGSPVTLADASPPAGKATATSAAVNTAANPLTPGRYCFRADWPGDTNYTGPFTHAGTGNSECFIVRQIPTTTVTTPSDSSGTALVSPVAFGTNLYDKAVVTGTAVGGNPPGTVNFFICNPSQVQGAAGAETCPDGFGSALSGNPRTLVADAGSSPPTSTVLSSPAVVGNTAGVWCFRAVYVPSGSTYTGSSDANHNECVSVGKASTTTVTTPSKSTTLAVGDTITDHAVVTGSAFDGTPTGTITFFICDPTQTSGGSGSETCATGGTQLNAPTATAVANSSPPQSSADSSTVTATSVGVWCFRAEYTPGGANGGNYTGSSDGSHSECFTVQDSTAATSAQSWVPNDTGTATATGGTALNGTLSIQLYTGGTCASGNAVSGQLYTKTLTNATSLADRSLTTNNTSFSVLTSQSVSWLVTFTPNSGTFVTGNSHCESTSLTITN